MENFSALRRLIMKKFIFLRRNIGVLLFLFVVASISILIMVTACTTVPGGLEKGSEGESYPTGFLRAFVVDTNVTVDASTVISVIPDELFGNNIAAWEGSTDGKDAFLNDYLKISGIKFIRYPGGSWADIVAWDTVGVPSSNSWMLDNNESINFAKAIGAQLQAIVNFSGYWDGVQHTHAEAVAKASNWVRYMNFTIGFPIKYWEIGNESYGSWEQGYTNGAAYGSRFADFYKAMKAVDSSIKIGAVATPYDNGDSWTGYNWWMRDMISNSMAKGVIPDFFIIHTYPMDENMSADADSRLLQAPQTIAQLTANLDAIVSKYIGPSYVGQIKYMMTEFRSVLNSRAQTLTFLDAMFTAQYLMEMAKYGWAGANIWNMRNGMDTAYQGDYGMFEKSAPNPRPVYYVYPLLTGKFGRNMVKTTITSNSIIQAYAAKDSAGNLTLFLVNNSPDQDYTVNVNISGFNAASSGLKWVLEPAGTTASGSTAPIQECTNIAYNGVVHPDASTTYYMEGISTSVGNSFSIQVKKSTMVLIRIPDKNSSSSSSISSMAFASSSSRPSDIIFDIPGKVEAEYYTNMSGIQIEACEDVDGGYDVGWIDWGDWCDYNINVLTGGSYIVDYRIAGVGAQGTIQIYIDGNWQTETSMISTGGWQIWTNVTTAAINLTAGRHLLRLFFNGTGYNINWANFRLASTSSSSIASSRSSAVSSTVSSISSSRSSIVSSVSSSRSSVVSSISSSRSSAVSSAISSAASSVSSVQYTEITLPFTKDGAGDLYWKSNKFSTTQNDYSRYINSWNVDILDINGVNCANKWVAEFTIPAASDGYWYIHYKGSYAWSHVEIK